MSLTTININACAYNVCVCARQTVLRADGSGLLLSDMQAIQAAYPDAEKSTHTEYIEAAEEAVAKVSVVNDGSNTEDSAE